MSETADFSELQALKALEAFIVDNDDLLTLESTIGRFNIFDALNIARTEIRHSNFLAFLLDPNESHGQGQLFLNAILMDLLKAAPPTQRPFSPIELDGADLRGIEVRREWNHIDLLVICREPEIVVALENKIDSSEHSGQLGRYKATMKQYFPNHRPLFVYLTLDGDEPSEQEWTPYSYGSLHRALSRVRSVYGKTLGEDIRIFLDHYINLIGTRFMTETDKSLQIDELCTRIYKNHRVALDLIFERIADPTLWVLNEAEDELRKDDRWHIFLRHKRHIDFVPRDWLVWLPALGLSNKDARYWIACRLALYPKSLDLYVEVRRMRDVDQRKLIIDHLITNGPQLGFKHSGREITDSYTRISGREKVLRWSEDEEPDSDKIKRAVRSLLDDKFAKLRGTRAVLEPLLASHGM